MSEEVFAGPPSPRLAEHHDRRAAETEKRFLGTTLERCVQGVNLNNPANRHRANFDKSQFSEVLGLEEVDIALVGEQDIVLVLQRLPMDSPKASSYALIAEGSAVVEIVDVVVINWGESRDEHWPPEKRTSAFRLTQNQVGTK
jgi:hypothetical protein